MHSHTFTASWVQFFYETSLKFCFFLPRWKSSLVYIIFQIPTRCSWSYLLPTHCMWTCLLSSMPPMQLTWRFLRENTCVQFTLWNRSMSCYTTHATYAAFLLGHLHPLYFKKHVHILQCYPHNLCSISKETFTWDPPESIRIIFLHRKCTI